MKYALNNIALTGRILLLYIVENVISARIVDTYKAYPKCETVIATIKLVMSCRPFSYLLRLWVFTLGWNVSP